RRVADIGGTFERRRRGRRKFHVKPARAQVAAELLAKQGFDVRLVIDDEDVNVQCSPPVFFCAGNVRGSVMTNSVNEPGSVATSIVPPCCFTTMSWLIDSPSPVPSPAGLVVKKGLNIFSFTSGGMPVPLSRMRISTLGPRFFVLALKVGSKPLSAV